LTQNTSWKNVEKALENLIKHNMLDFEKVYCSDIEFLKELIRPTGFYNQKAKTLKLHQSYF
jgi:endonuclease-3 related protein